jgi:mono/diheme cytochrome c family protein
MTTRKTWAIAAALLMAGLASRVLGQGAQNPANGRTVFAQTGCATCHGPEGRGTVAAPNIAAGARDLPGFIAYVRRPAGAMPAFTVQAVSDQALADVYAALYAPAAEAAKASQSAAAGGRVAVGATLFHRNGCFQCHANEGQGGTQGPRIGPNPVPFARFSWYVRNPSGDMPPYTAVVMSDQDLADVYAFLQARPQPPPVDTIPLLVP